LNSCSTNIKSIILLLTIIKSINIYRKMIRNPKISLLVISLWIFFWFIIIHDCRNVDGINIKYFNICFFFSTNGLPLSLNMMNQWRFLSCFPIHFIDSSVIVMLYNSFSKRVFSDNKVQKKLNITAEM
jgi:hypothetical protein